MEYTFLFYLGPIIFCIIGVILLIIGFSRTNKIKLWERTEGVVVKGSRGLLGILTPTVEYTVDDESYTYTSNIFQLPLLSLGTTIPIFYHPDYPKQAVIDTFMQRGEIIKVIGAGFIVVGSLFIILLFFFFSSLN